MRSFHAMIAGQNKQQAILVNYLITCPLAENSHPGSFYGIDKTVCALRAR